MHMGLFNWSFRPSQSILLSHRAKTVYVLSSTQKHVVCLWICSYFVERRRNGPADGTEVVGILRDDPRELLRDESYLRGELGLVARTTLLHDMEIHDCELHGVWILMR